MITPRPRPWPICRAVATLGAGEAWTVLTTLTLTNAIQSRALPVSTENQKFYRAVLEP